LTPPAIVGCDTTVIKTNLHVSPATAQPYTLIFDIGEECDAGLEIKAVKPPGALEQFSSPSQKHIVLRLPNFSSVVKKVERMSASQNHTGTREGPANRRHCLPLYF